MISIFSAWIYGVIGSAGLYLVGSPHGAVGRLWPDAAMPPYVTFARLAPRFRGGGVVVVEQKPDRGSGRVFDTQ